MKTHTHSVLNIYEALRKDWVDCANEPTIVELQHCEHQKLKNTLNRLHVFLFFQECVLGGEYACLKTDYPGYPKVDADEKVSTFLLSTNTLTFNVDRPEYTPSVWQGVFLA